ncbi:conserved hypothetical protein [Microcystis aeruginosa PCC 9809]|jgi:hypothetical protein|uniref:Uncharacterized protein n=2 Tax=Microcystis TaxID=1125 RepID=I4HWB0_MICAE|nr:MULTISPECIES: hypothetical protein [Microcystis]MCA2811417.1 hypothetical protein [Microcystis sp. M090S1]GCA88303.1 hypothetical protein MiTa_01645 [Microcystis aeruginosa NIES-4264]CCI26334.1 conserved hypothetical protein [Microcystis aeruginosa PCC 9809]
MTDERLERIESILQATVVLTQQNREDIAQLTGEVRTIAGSFERTNECLNQFITQAESDQQFFRNEVTGIRTEVKRIVEHLFGQSPDQE